MIQKLKSKLFYLLVISMTLIFSATGCTASARTAIKKTAECSAKCILDCAKTHMQGVQWSVNEQALKKKLAILQKTSKIKIEVCKQSSFNSAVAQLQPKNGLKKKKNSSFSISTNVKAQNIALWAYFFERSKSKMPEFKVFLSGSFLDVIQAENLADALSKTEKKYGKMSVRRPDFSGIEKAKEEGKLSDFLKKAKKKIKSEESLYKFEQLPKKTEYENNGDFLKFWVQNPSLAEFEMDFKSEEDAKAYCRENSFKLFDLKKKEIPLS